LSFFKESHEKILNSSEKLQAMVFFYKDLFQSEAVQRDVTMKDFIILFSNLLLTKQTRKILEQDINLIEEFYFQMKTTSNQADFMHLS